jgi:hypothetical protein
MQITYTGAAAAVLASASFLAHAGPDGAQVQEASLTVSTPKEWEYILPDEEWFAIRGPIFIGTHQFATQADGENQILVATTAGEAPKTGASVRGEILKLKAEGENGERFNYAIRVRGAASGGFEWSSAAVRTGTVEGVKVNLFDKNGNGVFNDVGLDAVGVGNRPGAALLGEVVRIGGTLFSCEVAADGSSIRWSPFTGELGSLDVTTDFALDAKLDAAVFSTTDGRHSFDLSDTKGPVSVPVGTYELTFGHVTKGSGTAQVSRGTMGTLSVTTEAGAQLVWGGELVGEPIVRRSGSEITITPQYRIFGNGGEEYHSFTPDPAPQRWEISEADTDKRLKKGSLPSG